MDIRHDWTREEIEEIYWTPLLDLVYRAATVHREHHNPREVQNCAILSVKTGGCQEDCKYCGQSAHYPPGKAAERMLSVEQVLADAQKAKDRGATRYCMGFAWRSPPAGKAWQNILEMVRGVAALNLEPCVTAGMITSEQAADLKEAGIHSYNHNLDTSERFYPEIISTRTYQDRLDTLQNIQDAGISLCCGGIIGLGETHDDRIDLIHTLATLPEHPGSVPINTWAYVPDTPLGQWTKTPADERLRVMATCRIAMPKSMVRISAGRKDLTPAEQALCFLAGANAIWCSDKLLVTDNSGWEGDSALFSTLGLNVQPSRPESKCTPSCPTAVG